MNSRGLAKKLAVAAIALAALLIAAAPADSATCGLSVKGYSVNGGIVQVTLKNTSSLSLSGTLQVQAMVNGMSVWSLVPVAVGPGQSMTVSAGFTGAVSDVMTVGVISDEGVPI